MFPQKEETRVSSSLYYKKKKNIWTYKWILNRSSDYEKWIGRNQNEASDTQGMTETLQI